MRPSVLHLGDKGAMLLARFLSIPAGFKFLTDANYVDHELQKWYKVSIVPNTLIFDANGIINKFGSTAPWCKNFFNVHVFDWLPV